MPTSEKQRLANQRNALKSTGPKTPEGKARSRRNGLKHGLSGAGVVLKKTDARAVQERVESWAEKLAPIDDLESCLVERAALASVRLERCVEVDLHDLARRRRRATKRWENRQKALVAKVVQRLETEPAAAVRELQNLSYGCNWLLEQWRALGDGLEAQGGWSAAQGDHAQRLLGKDPSAPYPGRDDVARLRGCLAAVQITPAPEAPAPEALAGAGGSGSSGGTGVSPVIASLDPSTTPQEPAGTAALQESQEARETRDSDGQEAEPGSQPPAPDATARDFLRALLASECTRLLSRRALVWQEQDGPDHDEAQARILVDTTTRGGRLLRHETSHELSMHRNLNQLVRLRKQEPETATLVRFEKEGKNIVRFWDGFNWKPWRSDEAPSAHDHDRDVQAEDEARAREEADDRERARRHGTPATIPPPGPPLSPGTDDHPDPDPDPVPVPDRAPSPESGHEPVPAGAQGEAIFSHPDAEAVLTYGAAPGWSRTGPEPCTDGASDRTAGPDDRSEPPALAAGPVAACPSGPPR